MYVKKKGSKKQRPLGLPTWSDKLLQEVIRLILNIYFDPQFSNASHGFRFNRGCHTALDSIRAKGGWKSVRWFVEGDIRDCFGNIDHGILLEILAEKVKDNRFVRLMKHFLECGYMEDWKYAYFGGFKLGYKKDAVIMDESLTGKVFSIKSELIDRLMKDTCELCGSSGNIEMHHVRKLKDLERNDRKAKPEWMKRMMAMRRKTLAVCLECHTKIHSGKYDGKRFISANVS